MFKKDKLLHMAVCFMATLLSYGYMRVFNTFWPSFSACWLLPIGLGVGKEYGDSKATGNTWDWADILADVIGTAVGMGIILLIYSVK